MWTLESEGDLFRGKRLWLRPGTKHLFGRTKAPAGSNDRAYAIDNKSVSRTHLVISVPPITPASGLDLGARTPVELTDGSKIGTHLDGRKFKDETVKLSMDEHTVVLGSFEQKFKLKWFPVVITPASVSRKSADPAAPYLQQLERCGIKISLDYVVGKTTHVVANKRNLPKCLQALVNAKHVVTSAFLDAIEQVTDPGQGEAAPLEEDFDASWPDAMAYVPPAGKEPNPRPQDIFEPSSKRLDIFAGFHLVFFDRSQLEQLGDVVNNGGGKAHFYELVRGKTTAGGFVGFTKSLKSNKVVVVRFPRNDATEKWTIDFLRDAELALGQRGMEQNEFLDAILTCDPSVLKRPLQEEFVDSSIPPPRALPAAMRSQQSQRQVQPAAQDSQSAIQDSPTAIAPVNPEPYSARRKAIRAPYKSRFADFDDFDADPASNDAPAAGAGASGTAMQVDEPRASQFESQPPASSQPQPQAPPTQARKRPHSPEPGTDGVGAEDFIDALMPTAAALKKRRVASGENGKAVAEPIQAKESRAQVKVEQEVNVREVANRRRQEQERRAAEEQERLREAMADMDVAEMRDLVVMEEMSLRARNDRNDDCDGDARWDDRWNGRRNFKKFRKVRRGEVLRSVLEPPRRALVGYVEMKRVDYGVGEEYWLESASRSAEKDSITSQARSQRSSTKTAESQTQRGVRESQIRQQKQGSAGSKASAVRRIVEADEVEDWERERERFETDDISQTLRSQPGGTASGKRKADAPPAVEKPAKKGRMGSSRRAADDDDDRDLKFRFRRGR